MKNLNIGVIHPQTEFDKYSVREFFQLLKVPIEDYELDKDYDVIITTGEVPDERNYETIIIVTNDYTNFDTKNRWKVEKIKQKILTEDENKRISIFTGLSKFSNLPNDAKCLLKSEKNDVVSFSLKIEKVNVVRVGLNVFREVGFILNKGLPLSEADFPYVDFYVDFLRKILASYTILVEIPPVPWSKKFILALTHDVDTLSLSEKKFSRTFLGALRETVVNLPLKAIKYRKSNYMSISLKFLHNLLLFLFKLKKDPWLGFDEWIDLEKSLGVKSTWFFVPLKKQRGKGCKSNTVPRNREVNYDFHKNKHTISKLKNMGNEIGCHGIDCWNSIERGRDEYKRIKDFAGNNKIGNRVHHLYWDNNSFKILDECGFYYDSSFGFNEICGFKAGTTQVYKPFGARKLLELPLHIMDGVLYLFKHKQLDYDSSVEYIKNEFFAYAEKFGGVLTILWHRRSIFPPYCWENAYRNIVKLGQKKGAWVTSAIEIVEWFRTRRRIRLNVTKSENELKIDLKNIDSGIDSTLPPPQLVIHQGAGSIADVNVNHIKDKSKVCVKIESSFVTVKLKSGG